VGERISARGLATLAQEVYGEPFELITGGTISELSDRISRLKEAASPEDRELYPAWQLMMYMRTMFGIVLRWDRSTIVAILISIGLLRVSFWKHAFPVIPRLDRASIGDMSPVAISQTCDVNNSKTLGCLSDVLNKEAF
jgi:hypothetical protein